MHQLLGNNVGTSVLSGIPDGNDVYGVLCHLFSSQHCRPAITCRAQFHSLNSDTNWIAQVLNYKSFLCDRNLQQENVYRHAHDYLVRRVCLDFNKPLLTVLNDLSIFTDTGLGESRERWVVNWSLQMSRPTGSIFATPSFSTSKSASSFTMSLIQTSILNHAIVIRHICHILSCWLCQLGSNVVVVVDVIESNDVYIHYKMASLWNSNNALQDLTVYPWYPWRSSVFVKTLLHHNFHWQKDLNCPLQA